jgi:hypothetical protein
MILFNKKTRLARLQEEAMEEERRAREGDSYPDRKWILDATVLEKLGITEWRPSEGDNYVQFVPADDPENKHSIGATLWFHRNVGPNGDTFLCLRKMFGKPCPVCEEFQSRKSEDWNAIKHLSIGNRPSAWLFLLVDVANDETIKEGVRVYVAPKTVRDEVINVVDRRTGAVKFAPHDPEEGRVFCFNRVGTGKEDTRYSKFEYRDEHEDLPKEYYENLPTFESLLYVPTYDEVLSAHKGTPAPAAVAAEQEQPTKEEPKTPARVSRVRRPVSEPQTLDVGEDEVPFEEEEEEVVQPRTRRRPL